MESTKNIITTVEEKETIKRNVYGSSKENKFMRFEWRVSKFSDQTINGEIFKIFYMVEKRNILFGFIKLWWTPYFNLNYNDQVNKNNSMYSSFQDAQIEMEAQRIHRSYGNRKRRVRL